MSNLYETIEDSISDAELPPEEPEVEAAPEAIVPEEVVPEPEAAPTEPVPEETPTTEVASPGAPKPDEFEKKFGIPASVSGRENRIPYSRVKKITEKAVLDGVTAKTRELESVYTPKIQEFETKIKDYEGRLKRVAEFEHVMMNDQDQFLQMLSKIPAYGPFFDAVSKAFSGQATPTTPAAPEPTDLMPEPDQKLTDGTTVYSMEGLKALLKWQADQVEGRVTKKYEERYKPMETEWEAHQKVQAVIPQVQAQITEARTWAKFNEHEADIVKALQDNPKLSLEGAYRQIVIPKLEADRTSMREALLKEIKQAPVATSTPAKPTRVVPPPPSSGPRNLEDVIAESLQSVK